MVVRVVHGAVVVVVVVEMIVVHAVEVWAEPCGGGVIVEVFKAARTRGARRRAVRRHGEVEDGAVDRKSVV